MGGRRASAAGSDRPTEFTQTLLARLGLPPDATPHDIEAVHGRLVTFLDSAPTELHGWARQQARTADAAVALLTHEATDVGGEAARDDREDESSADDALDEDEFDEDAFPASGQGKSRAGGRADRTNPSRPALALSAGWLRRSRLIPVVLILAVAAVVFGVYQLGDRGVPPVSPNASSSTQPLDQAKVADLMQKLSANPKDVQTLGALGDLYFQAGDYKTAASWQQKIVDIDSKHVNARLALGAALFNMGDGAAAEKQWLEVVAIDPKHAEAHYDLGFLYLSKNPPDMVKVKAEWAKVVEIDPNSELAKTVSAHVQRLENSPSPSTSGK